MIALSRASFGAITYCFRFRIPERPEFPFGTVMAPVARTGRQGYDYRCFVWQSHSVTPARGTDRVTTTPAATAHGAATESASAPNPAGVDLEVDKEPFAASHTGGPGTGAGNLHSVDVVCLDGPIDPGAGLARRRRRSCPAVFPLSRLLAPATVQLGGDEARSRLRAVQSGQRPADDPPVHGRRTARHATPGRRSDAPPSAPGQLHLHRPDGS